MKSSIVILVSGIIIGIFISTQFFSGCGRTDNPCPELVDSTFISENTRKVFIDTIPYIDTVKTVDSGNSNFTPEDMNVTTNVDSSIWYSQGEDTMMVDGGVMKVIATASTFGNTLKNINFKWKFTKVRIDTTTNIVTIIQDSTVNTIEKTYKVPERKNVFYVGTSVGVGSNQIQDINFNLTWLMKNQRQIYYELSQPLQGNVKFFHRVGIKIPIRLGKKD